MLSSVVNGLGVVPESVSSGDSMTTELMEHLRECVAIQRHDGNPLFPNTLRKYAEHAIADAELLLNMPEIHGDEVDYARAADHLEFAAAMYRVVGGVR